MNSGGLENVKVDKEMMKYVDKAHIQYMYRLKTKKIKLLLKKKRRKKEAILSKKQKKQNKNALNNCREKLLNMIPRFSIWKKNLGSNNLVAVFQL